MNLRVSTYIKWWKIWGTLPVAAWVSAAKAYREGKFDRAVELYREGITKFPNHPARFSAHLDLAFCLQKINRAGESEEPLRFVANNAPHIKDGHLRLARLQLFLGQALEASWTMRRCVQKISPDGEMVGLFLNAVLENDGPGYLLQEAIDLLKKIPAHERGNILLRAACARLAVCRGSVERGLGELAKLAEDSQTTPEIVLIYAEALLDEKQISAARYQLRRVLARRPNHPMVLSLLAKSYLESGMFFEPDTAVELAVLACQSNSWSSPRELHILAEAYHELGDKAAALLAASKAKDVGSKLLSSYRDVKDLEQLIENLSTQSLM